MDLLYNEARGKKGQLLALACVRMCLQLASVQAWYNLTTENYSPALMQSQTSNRQKLMIVEVVEPPGRGDQHEHESRYLATEFRAGGPGICWGGGGGGGLQGWLACSVKIAPECSAQH